MTSCQARWVVGCPWVGGGFAMFRTAPRIYFHGAALLHV